MICLTDLYLKPLSHLISQEVIVMIAWFCWVVGLLFFFPFTVPGFNMRLIEPNFISSSFYKMPDLKICWICDYLLSNHLNLCAKTVFFTACWLIVVMC